MIINPYPFSSFKDNLSSIHTELSENGIVFFSEINTIEKGIALSHAFGCIVQNLDANTRGITEISETVAGKNENNNLAFTQNALYPHTDRSPIATPPKYLFNWVKLPADKGGDSLFVDGKQLYTLLSVHHPKALAMLEEPIATFTDNINSFTGSIFSCDTSGNIIIRYRNDSCILVDPKAEHAIDLLNVLIKQATLSLSLSKGEAYLLDNTRWLHGRTAYQGHRIIYRLHINPSDKEK